MNPLLLKLILLVHLSPVQAAYIAAWEIGRLDIAPALVAICDRESDCKNIGAHEIDAHLSGHGWRSQTRMGHLNKECQPYVRGGWATRGAFGLSAASHWEYLPECYSPDVLDSPLVSARVSAEKYLKRCDRKTGKKKDNSWCPTRRAVKGVDLGMAHWAFQFLTFYSDFEAVLPRTLDSRA